MGDQRRVHGMTTTSYKDSINDLSPYLSPQKFLFETPKNIK